MTEKFHKALTVKLKNGPKFKIEALDEGMTAMELFFWMGIIPEQIEYTTYDVQIKLRSPEEIAEKFAEKQIERIRKDSF